MKVSRNQWRKWSVPSKASYLGFWIGVVGVVLAMWSMFYKPDVPLSSADIVIRSANPTNVSLAGVDVQNMIGDAESSLVARYQNESKLTARSFHVKAVLGREELEPFQSSIYRGIDMNTLGILPEHVLEMPVVPVSNLEERIGESICGVGVRPVDFETPRPERCQSTSHLRSTPLNISAFYKTDFGEAKVMNSMVWLYHCQDCESLNRRI